MGLKIQRRVTTKARVITTLIAVFALIAQPGYSFVAGQVANAQAGNTINVCKVATADCTYTDIQAAVTGATGGDTIVVAAGTYSLTSTVIIDKPLTIMGEPNAVITADNVYHAFNLNADNITIKGLVFTSFSKMANDGYLYVHTANVTIQANIFAGQYSFGDGQVTRGIVVGPNSATNLTIKNNYFHSLRQPAYIDNGTTGTISNNFAQGTKGWVVGADSDLAFTGNSWGTTADANSGNQKNAVDIAIIKNASARDGYSNIVALSQANNNAAIDNQYVGALSVAYVDENANPGGNGYWNSPYTNLQAAINSVSVDGSVEMSSNSTVTSQATISKSVTLNGNNHTLYSKFSATPGGENNSALGIRSANGVTINDLTVDGSKNANTTNATKLAGINTFKSTATLNKVVLNNNEKYGLIVNGSIVTVDTLTTNNNGWGGVDVDQASTSNRSMLTVNGTSSHNEALKDIFIDDTTKPVTVVGNTSQYTVTDYGTARLYKTKLATPTGLNVTNSDGQNFVCDTDTNRFYTNKNQVTLGWNAVPHASKYDYNITAPGNVNVHAVFPTNSATGPFNLSGEANPREGTFTWNVAAINALGAVSDTSTNCSMTYDKTNPTITAVISDNVINSTDSNPILTVDARDVLSGIGYSEYKINNAQGNLVRDWTNITDDTAEIDTAGLDGTYTITARTFDKAGNKKSGAYVAFSVDKVSPVVTYSGYASATRTLTGSLIDADDVTAVKIKIGATASEDVVVNADKTTWSYIVPASFDADTYSFIVSATDAAMNVGTTDSSATAQTAPRLFTIERISVLDAPFNPVNPSGVIAPGEVTAPIRAPFFQVANTVGPATLVDPASVLGTQTTKDKGNVLGFSKDAAALAPSAEGWKIFGAAWYWWVLIVAAVGAIMWWIVAAARRRNQEA